MTRGESADGALVVVLSEVSNKVSGGKVTSVGLLAAPVNEQAVGPAIEHAVEPDGVAAAQAAAIVVARGVETGVQASFDGPVLDICFEPQCRRELALGAAGDQGDRFSRFALTVDARGLGHQGEAGGLPVEVACDQRAGHRVAFF